jgi:hypothetical protein
VKDSGEPALSDWLAAGGEGADHVRARRYLEASDVEILGWCERELGTVWSELRPHKPNSIARWHLPAGGGRMSRSSWNFATAVPG